MYRIKLDFVGTQTFSWSSLNIHASYEILTVSLYTRPVYDIIDVSIALLTLILINTKNCSLSIVLTATDQKPQKSLKRWYYPPSHCPNFNVMLSNVTFFLMIFAVFDPSPSPIDKASRR